VIGLVEEVDPAAHFSLDTRTVHRYGTAMGIGLTNMLTTWLATDAIASRYRGWFYGYQSPQTG